MQSLFKLFSLSFCILDVCELGFTKKMYIFKKRFLDLMIFLMRRLPPEISSFLSLEAIKTIYFFDKNFFSSKNSNSNKIIKFKNLRFLHPLGLAAGLDKEGKYFDSLGSIGFSFIEVGTFTPRPQSGNKHPRIKRILKNESLINRLGFNNPGINQGVLNVKRIKKNYRGILGISIGKNKSTNLDEAFKDYVYCLERSFEVADYIAINISSPNTFDLRKLSSDQYIDNLLKQLVQESKKLEKLFQKKIPLIIKLSPDESAASLERIVNTSIEYGISGFIISNTMYGNYQDIEGGISGKMLRDKSMNALKIVHRNITSDQILISSGGIFNNDDLEERLDHGARLVQIYTSFVYRGPKVLEEILN